MPVINYKLICAECHTPFRHDNVKVIEDPVDENDQRTIYTCVCPNASCRNATFICSQVVEK